MFPTKVKLDKENMCFHYFYQLFHDITIYIVIKLPIYEHQHLNVTLSESFRS